MYQLQSYSSGHLFVLEVLNYAFTELIIYLIRISRLLYLLLTCCTYACKCDCATTSSNCLCVLCVHVHERVITVGIGWVLLASATSGFSGYIKLAYCSSAKGAPVAHMVRASD